MANVNENIKILRNRMGITQERFAELVGINRKAVGAYEENRATPPLDKLNKISKLFGITLDELTHQSFDKESSKEEVVITEPKIDFSQLIEKKKPFSRTGGQISFFDDTKDDLIRYISHKYFDKYVLDADFENRIPDMPILSFPLYETKNTLRAFDIPVESYLATGILIGEQLTSFSDIEDKQYYLVISSKKGLFFKKIVHGSNEGFMVLSDQKGETDFNIHPSEIKEVWKPVGYISKEIPKSQPNLSSLSSKINALKTELDNLL